MANQLFDRKAVVIVGSLKVTDLRMQFKVHKDNTPKPKVCEVTISNLNKDTRGQMQDRGDQFILQAGYPGTIETLLSGTTRTVDTVEEGPTTNTLIRAGDGEMAYNFATISKSYGAGYPVNGVLNDLLDNFKDPITGTKIDPGLSKQIFSTLTGKYLKGISLHGKVSDHFDQIMQQLGFEWSIQNGRMQVLQQGGNTTEQIISLSPTTGLVGSPQHGTGDGKVPQKGANTVKFKSVLMGGIKPGRLVNIKSEGVNGVVRVISCEHKGDTFGGDWNTEAIGEPVSNVTVVG